jgi:predicted RNA-binding Zn-ribbon protein involved in translation (DUF1610 family)
MKTILFLVIIPFFILICILIVKYIFIPFSKPQLSLRESIDFLGKRNCTYIDHLSLKKTELRENHFNRKKGISFRKALSSKSEFKLIGYSRNENLYKLYWIEITFWWFIFGKGFFELLVGDKIEQRKELKFIEETDLQILGNLNKNYEIETVIVSDKCPACGAKILPNDMDCKECGLEYRN